MAQNKIIIEKGQKFGKLSVIEEIESKRNSFGKKVRYFSCSCDCGNTTEKALYSLRSGNCKSCGCLPKGRKTMYPEK